MFAPLERNVRRTPGRSSAGEAPLVAASIDSAGKSWLHDLAERVGAELACQLADNTDGLSAADLKRLLLRKLSAEASVSGLAVAGSPANSRVPLVVVAVLSLRSDEDGSMIDLSSCVRLSKRERDVAALLARRRSNREVSLMLGISEHTVKRNVERVLAKLQVSSRREVAAALNAVNHQGVG